MTDVGCAGEIIKDGEGGIVIKIGDKGALTSSMIKLVEDKNFGTKIREGAQKAILALSNAEQSLELYKKSFNM
jgi:glycosyltransferase involved in cell wall biosynthesis